MIVGPITL